MHFETRSGGRFWQLTAAMRCRVGCAALLAASAACGGKTDAGADASSTASGAQQTSTMQSSAAGAKAVTGAAGKTAPPTPAAQGGTSASSAATASPTAAAMSGSAVAGIPAAPAAGEGGSAGAVAVAGTGGSATGAAPAGGVQCAMVKGATTDARLHMHHIHFNTQDPNAAADFVQKYFNAMPFDYCTDASGTALRASKTERAYFLYTKVAAPPSNMRLNRLAHVGYLSTDVASELKRMNELKVPLADASVCATAAMGTPCNTAIVQWFYVDMPESARFEIADGPGPATSGFGHIHLVAPDYTFFQKVLGDALQDPNGNPNVDEVNMVASGRTGVLDNSVMYQDTRGAAIDHVGFSTGDLEGTQKRIEAAGIKIEEPISLKPEGFRSFMVRSSEGIWLEILEGDGFKK